VSPSHLGSPEGPTPLGAAQRADSISSTVASPQPVPTLWGMSPARAATPPVATGTKPTRRRTTERRADTPRPERPMGTALLRPLKTAETVARQIVDDIVTRRLRTGDRLPSEAIMTKQYGVSRESFREALRLLEVQGLIVLRRGNGGGPVVGSVDPANLGRISTLYYHLAGGTYADLFDAQAVAEGVLAELAANNADRTLVRAAMTPFMHSDTDDAKPTDATEYLKKHVHFHVVVARLASNPVLELMLQTLTQIVSHHLAVTADPRDVREEVAHSHNEIARAIAAGHPAESRELMEHHTRRVAGFYATRIGAQTNDLIEWR
jgi:GntR family transcriptional repressor for pyruvate dehydrogenase complex